ncbi:MAG: hypothetical protein E7205_09480 [Tissierellaceae bacterium]|nr:hypothetical protein [Tissierellaceae bacterium]
MSMKNDKGYIILSVVMILSIILIFGLTMITVAGGEFNQTLIQEKKVQAYYIARSGAIGTADWISKMSGDDLKKFNESLPLYSKPVKFGEGEFVVSIVKSGDNLYITSTGKVPYNKSTVDRKAELVMSGDKSGDSQTVELIAAVFGNSSIEIRGGTVKGNIGSNSEEPGSIHISGWPTIEGNIEVLNDDVIKVDNSEWKKQMMPDVEYIEKQSYPIPLLPEFPEDLPEGLPTENPESHADDGILTVYWENNNTVIGSSRYYDSINIIQNTTLRVDTSDGDIVLRVRNLNIEQGRIEVVGDGKLYLYVDNNFKVKGGINEREGKTDNVKIYSNSSNTINVDNETQIYASLYSNSREINISGSGSVYGDLITAGSKITINGGARSMNIYAPKASIDIGGGASVTGGIVGGSIVLGGGCRIDSPNKEIKITLPDSEEDGSSGSAYKIAYWR